MALFAPFATFAGLALFIGDAEWLGVLIGGAWVGAPLALPYLLSWADTGNRIRAIFFAIFVAASLFTGWIFYITLSSDSSTAGLGFFILPPITWGGTIALSALTCL